MEETGFSYAAKLGAPQEDAFRRALQSLNSSIPRYLVAGAFAEHAYTGIWRNTNDLDIFLKAEDVEGALTALNEAGFETRVEDELWIAKAFWGSYFVDLIFGMSNGLLPVTGEWFEGCHMAEIAGVQTRLIPIEELIAAKVYIALRLRFDGADVVHLIRSAKGRVDWQRILNRLGDKRELLLWHLILFDFVYPGHSEYLPRELMDRLYEEARARWRSPSEDHRFRGTLLDPYSFNVDVRDWNYEESRDLRPIIREGGKLR